MRRQLVFILMIACISGCSQYELDYLIDQADSSNVVTRIRHKGHTYFVYGSYTEKKLPEDSYLRIGDEKLRSDYDLFLYWKGDTAHLEALQGGIYTPVNLPDKFVFYEADRNEIERFTRFRHDTTGRYTYICDCDLPSPKPNPLPENYGKPIKEQVKLFKEKSK